MWAAATTQTLLRSSLCGSVGVCLCAYPLVLAFASCCVFVLTQGVIFCASVFPRVSTAKRQTDVWCMSFMQPRDRTDPLWRSDFVLQWQRSNACASMFLLYFNLPLETCFPEFSTVLMGIKHSFKMKNYHFWDPWQRGAWIKLVLRLGER